MTCENSTYELAAFVTGDQPTISGRAIFRRITPDENVPHLVEGLNCILFYLYFMFVILSLGYVFSVVTLTCQCLSDETLKAVGPFYLVSMPGELKDPTSPHWNV